MYNPFKKVWARFACPQLLRNKTVYLIGAIDRAEDLGSTWRSQIQKMLRRKFHCNVYNPLEKPIDTGVEGEEARKYNRGLKITGKYDEFSKRVRTIRCVDLRMVDKSDFIICYIDMDIPMCGTIEELTTANRQKKPVIVFCKQGKINIPDWLFGMLPHDMFFDTIEEVIEYLKKVNAGFGNHTDRWMFFDR